MKLTRNKRRFYQQGKLLRHLNCMLRTIKLLWGGRPARAEYTI